MSGARTPGGEPMSCDQVREVAPDLALDLLDGADRAAALSHLEHCADCRADVIQLTDTGAQLLPLAPQVPPPAGFEQRVLDRLAGSATASAASSPPVTDNPSLDRRGRRQLRQLWRDRLQARRRERPGERPGPRRRVLVAGLVPVLVLVVALGALAAIGRFRANDDAVVTTSAEMRTAEGATAGWAELRGDEPVTVDVDLTAWAALLASYDLPEDHRWSLTLDLAGGGQETFPLTSDAWTAELTVPGADSSEVQSIALVDETGRIWCTGTFTS